MRPLITAWAGLVWLGLACPAPAQTPSFPRVHTGGFAAVELHTTSDNVREGLDLAELDIYSTVELSNSWSALVDGVAQHNWRRNEEDHLELDLERAFVEYSSSDAFRIEIGQTPTGIIRWSERENRSRILQTPIDVPAIARRPQDDGAWPLRFLGAWVSSRIPGPLGARIAAGAGFGSSVPRDAIHVLGHPRAPATVLSVSSAPDAFPGLELAVTGYMQRLPIEQTSLRERDLTLSASYENRGTEVRTEWARMHHSTTAPAAKHDTTGYYILLSKRLPGGGQRWRPYLLLDRLRVASGESYLASASDENAWAAGARYDVAPHFTIKAEYRSQRAIDGDRESVAGLQFGVWF